ncbi:hypothetical protein CEXT_141581 [Caerostris extrusa]|uniref:Uncharacterized protein n=1 Tax=Caerostris extrusa TaxID=172846 RepID=A0AAV4VE98_CAEEX|nr:hypothetical protein CEXT_141581 [Caerostris extrusa]
MRNCFPTPGHPIVRATSSTVLNNHQKVWVLCQCLLKRTCGATPHTLAAPQSITKFKRTKLERKILVKIEGGMKYL